MEFLEVEVPVEKYDTAKSPSHSFNLRLSRGDSRETWDPIRSAREREFREKPPPMLKIAIVGDSAVGKTTICEAFTSETGFVFSKKYQMTCGVQVYGKTIRLPDEIAGELNPSPVLPKPGSLLPLTSDVLKEPVNLILLDSSSKDIYLDLLPKYWDKLDGVVLVTDVTDPASFTNCSKWLELVRPCLINKSDFLGVLLANKIDSGEDRSVSGNKAQETAVALNLRCFEVTAKENSGLDDPFMYLAKEWASRKIPHQK